MILYVNGDSHSAGADSVTPYSFANDDPLYYALGRIPHPDNERASYGCLMANELGAVLHCDAESASSNSRILRTTRQYLSKYKPDAVVIGWSTWEREEWLQDGIWWQVNAGGVGHDWPRVIKEKYRQYVLDIDWDNYTKKAHDEIYALHTELKDLKIPHLFFNCYSDFSSLYDNQKDWGLNYLAPYDLNMTYYNWLTNNGFQANKWYHFGADAHRKWADFLLPHLTKLL